MSALAVGKRFNPYRRFSRFSVLPDGLVAYPGLSFGAKVLWGKIAQYAGKDGRAYPSVATLASAIGLKERHTQNLLLELKREGFIETSRGPGANSYYFLLHPCLLGGLRQDIAGPYATKCSSGMQEVAPKKTKEDKQRKETTKKTADRRVSFEDLSDQEQRYIELKVAYEVSKGKIHSSASAYRAGLVKKASEGDLDISGLKDLEVWKKNLGRSDLLPEAVIRSTDKEVMRQATIDRVWEQVQDDGRSPKDLCSLIKERGKKRPPKGLWGLSYQSVAMGLKVLFPDHWEMG